MWQPEEMVDEPDDLDLTAPQTRVLGCLMEKQATTPDVYPLTLKALTTACNQTSNRDPVVDYDPQLVETTLMALKGKGLARIVHPTSGERATKYRHVADEALGLDRGERALIAVLLLRGAQTAAELRTRCERMNSFVTPAEVEQVLTGLAERPRPLVRRLERQPGQKESRWIQLLEANADQRAAAAPTRPSAAPRAAGRVEELEARIAELERRFDSLVTALGDLIDGGPSVEGPADGGPADEARPAGEPGGDPPA